MELLNFVGGEFVPAESKKTFLKISPFNGEELGQVADSEAMDVIKALQIAKKAAPTFRDLTVTDRAQFLLKLADFFEQRAQEIAHAEALHQGLSQKFVLKNSVEFSIQLLRRVAQDALSFSDTKTVLQPSGVVGILTSWSCSLRLVIERLAPALAAGNVVLIKVSEQSPITAKFLGEAFQEIMLPAGAVSVLQGGKEIGQLIASHPGIRAVTAVGKTFTLEDIAKAGVTQFKKLQLSGSAKNPAVVLNDSHLEERLPEILYPFLMGQGQLCWNTSRIFVLESFAPAFIEAVKNYFSHLKPLLDPRGEEVWTPMISAQAVKNIGARVQEGLGEHGKVFSVEAGLPETGFFFRPTVMLDLSNCSVLQQDELQGPLLLITPVKYQHEAVKWANTSYLAHSGIIWGPAEKFNKLAGQLDVAHVWLNSWLDNEVFTIFGHKQSSFGNPDMSWSGSFYSDVKKLAGS